MKDAIDHLFNSDLSIKRTKKLFSIYKYKQLDTKEISEPQNQTARPN